MTMRRWNNLEQEGGLTPAKRLERIETYGKENRMMIETMQSKQTLILLILVVDTMLSGADFFSRFPDIVHLLGAIIRL